jgi:hypothetical protein
MCFVWRKAHNGAWLNQNNAHPMWESRGAQILVKPCLEGFTWCNKNQPFLNYNNTWFYFILKPEALWKMPCEVTNGRTYVTMEKPHLGLQGTPKKQIINNFIDIHSFIVTSTQ